MKNTSRERAILNILDMEEENVNSIIFAIGFFGTIIAGIIVVGFLGGTLIDWSVLLISAVFALIRFLEKCIASFGKYAKYAYLTLPIWGSCVLVITNDGKYAAATQFYFVILMAAIAYYDIKMILWCAGLTIISVILGLAVFPDAFLKLDNLGVWIYILYVYIMAVVLSIIIVKHMQHLLGKTRKMKEYEYELVYLEQLEKKEEKQREFIHNINHYFIAISELARIEKCDQIVNIVEELNGKLRKNERIIYSKYKVLNAILAEKINEAKEQNIKFEVNVEPMLKLDSITDGDMVSMLGNLLDNALEAAMQCQGEKRKIYLWIYMENDGRVCVIKLVNYFVNPRIQSKSGFISTKKNKEMHGIGIKSVKNTSKKYGGHLQCLVEGEKFLSILVLPNRK